MRRQPQSALKGTSLRVDRCEHSNAYSNYSTSIGTSPDFPNNSQKVQCDFTKFDRPPLQKNLEKERSFVIKKIHNKNDDSLLRLYGSEGRFIASGKFGTKIFAGEYSRRVTLAMRIWFEVSSQSAAHYPCQSPWIRPKCPAIGSIVQNRSIQLRHNVETCRENT